MQFNSLEFILVFVPLLCITFIVVSNKYKLYTLLGASLCFYGYHSIFNLYLMLSSILFNFALGQRVAHNKMVLIFGIVCNLAIIAYFKYSMFIVETFNILGQQQVNSMPLAIPLGISFFTFQQISYLVDIYYGTKPAQSIAPYALFVSFFPHSIAGPLVEYKDISTQLGQIRMSLDNAVKGFSIFIVGLFKKVIIADGLASYVNLIFHTAEQGSNLSCSDAWLGATIFLLQLYFDFSGYSDMAIGLAKVFNINFPINFNSPLQATSVIELWQRWHMTLSKLLRKLLYIPLGGNRKGELVKYRNIFITMLIAGFWHGAGWTFALWGVLQGLYIIINHVWRNLYINIWPKVRHNQLYKISCWIITITCAIISVVLFRANNLSTALTIYKSMFRLDKTYIASNILNTSDYLPSVIVAAAICFGARNTNSLFINPKNSFKIKGSDFAVPAIYWQPSVLYAVIFAAMTATIITFIILNSTKRFLYFDF